MVPLHVELVNSTLRRVIKRLHFPLEMVLVQIKPEATQVFHAARSTELQALHSRRQAHCGL